MTSLVCVLHHDCGCHVPAVKVTIARDLHKWLPMPGEQTDAAPLGQGADDVFYVRSAAGLPLKQCPSLAVLSTTRAPCVSKL